MSSLHQGHWYKGLEYGSNETQLNPFFYGVTLEHKPESMTYQSDAISANTHLTPDYFQRHHKYSLEWEPPDGDREEGYLKWYLDDKLLYGINGESLRVAKTEIPSEPMYLLINTAVASSWGFPKPCPDGCTCDCYECGNPKCTCGLPDGFCENFPASFEIEYVRAYQAKNHSNHLVGCSTMSRPTAKYIMGHKKDFVNNEEGQKEPLQPIQRGGGYCKLDVECGYPTKGACSDSRRCVCNDNFTGPKCLSHAGSDDTSPPTENLEVDMLSLPPVFLALVVFAAITFIAYVGIAVFKRRRQVEKYEQLPSNSVSRQDMDILRTMQQQGPAGLSYQGMGTAPTNLIGANEQKTVTYCMIDGRLLDE